jgi:hypothetical protein
MEVINFEFLESDNMLTTVKCFGTIKGTDFQYSILMKSKTEVIGFQFSKN